MHTSQGLPPYTVQESSRARRVRIRVAPRSGVTVVVPRGYDQGRIPALLRQRRDWLDDTILRMREEENAGREWAQQAGLPEPPPPQCPGTLWAPPESIRLLAVSEEWTVEHMDTDEVSAKTSGRSGVRVSSRGPGLLSLRGSVQNPAVCAEALRRWLLERGRVHLSPWLRELSRRHDLPYENVRLRTQKSRWGSCSSGGTISLNARLLFLPEPLVEHVLLHELAHTRHLNHGREFYALLAALDPDCARHDSLLSGAWRYVPAWAESD